MLHSALHITSSKRNFFFETEDIQLALLDIHLQKHMDGIELAKWMSDHNPVPFIFLTAFRNEITLEKAKAVHPAYYLVKPFDKTQLKIAIEIAGSNYYNPNSEQQLSRKIYKFNRSLFTPLTSREIEIMRHLAVGLNNRELSQKLFLSEHTIKSHLKSIFLKTGAKSRADLIGRINQM
ncbi:MAG: DNA-binding response regulator [Saprospirales bacterium]|nr:MAG: DNA-binding response regulator [Saprospirales bacterium]